MGATAPGPAEMGERPDPEITVPDWLNGSSVPGCGSHETDMVVTGERR
jgi:hypothetical protein